MKKIAALLLLLWLLCHHAHAASSDTLTMSFTSTRNLMLVDAVIDGHACKLIFDTGAEQTMLNDSRNVLRQVTVGVGDRSLGRMSVAFVDLNGSDIRKAGADGVLGEDVLRRYATVSVDYNAHTITLSK